MQDQPPTGPGETQEPDYAWTHRCAAIGPSPDPERLLRAVWEEGSAVLRWLLPLGWRFGLGLRLGPEKSAEHVMGWAVSERTSARITVAASSRIMQAQNSVTVEAAEITWTTRIAYENALGRLVWAPASILHQLVVPRVLSGALSRLAD